MKQNNLDRIKQIRNKTGIHPKTPTVSGSNPYAGMRKTTKFEKDIKTCKNIESLISVYKFIRAHNFNSPDELRHFFSKVCKPEGKKELLETFSDEKYKCKLIYKMNLTPDVRQLLQANKYENIRGLLTAELQKVGCDFETAPYEPVSEEESRAIRIQFSGGVNQPPPEKCAYDIHQNRHKEINYKPEDYDLESSSVAQTFKKLKYPASVFKKMEKALVAAKIPPEDVAELNIYDYENLLYNHNRQPGDEEGFAPIMTGAKKAAVKAFVINHESQIVTMLTEMDVSQEYINIALQNMKNGKLPNGKLQDKQGNVFYGPSFTVHHKTAVQDAHKFQDVSQINDIGNFAIMLNTNRNADYETREIVSKYPDLHDLAHKTDKPLYYENDNENGEKLKVTEKVKLPANVLFMVGFSARFQINCTEDDKKSFAKFLNEEYEKTETVKKNRYQYNLGKEKYAG